MERYIEIDGWKSQVTFSACHMLLRHDKCSRLHGHTYAIHLRIKGLPGEDMLVLDFHLIKNAIRGIAKELDHMTLVPGDNLSVTIERGHGQNISIDMLGKVYSIPSDDVLVLPVKATTVEELSRYILELFLERIPLPEVIHEVSLGVDEGHGQGAWASIRLR
ncbi:MAG: 6-carboxytetrahydropterin synthase [Candidatus Thermoplasmatota archaeon]|nr:6-carboxytetrahydropterin synthase [Candidatus Thermoplasmatota archaeon]